MPLDAKLIRPHGGGGTQLELRFEVANISTFLNGGIQRRRFLRTSSDIKFTVSVKIWTWSVRKFVFIDFCD